MVRPPTDPTGTRSGLLDVTPSNGWRHPVRPSLSPEPTHEYDPLLQPTNGGDGPDLRKCPLHLPVTLGPKDPGPPPVHTPKTKGQRSSRCWYSSPLGNSVGGSPDYSGHPTNEGKSLRSVPNTGRQRDGHESSTPRLSTIPKRFQCLGRDLVSVLWNDGTTDPVQRTRLYRRPDTGQRTRTPCVPT